MLDSNESLLAILRQWEGSGEEQVDMTMDYLSLLLAKLLLNIFMAFYARPNLTHSLMGFNFLSLCLADFLLVTAFAATTVCPVGACHDNALSLAFLVSHSSAVYAALPLPMLLLGALDYAAAVASSTRAGVPQREQCLGWSPFARLGAVLTLWWAAMLHSAWTTDSSLSELQLEPELGGRTLVCKVQLSREVTLLCVTMLLGITLVLAPHLFQLPTWASQTSYFSTDTESKAHRSAISYVEMEGFQHSTGVVGQPPLSTDCALRLALHWCPYLLVHLGGELLGLAIPAYASVNTLWLCCANSLLVGSAYWVMGGVPRPGLDIQRLDGVCDWQVSSHVSLLKAGNGLSSHKLPQELKTPTDRKHRPLLLI